MPQAQSKMIGRYKILTELGGGGMGDVYRIWDPATDRELALKRLKFSYPRALHYFKREFRAVSSLSHPNLVSLYDLHSDGGQYYYTMELIDGTDIYEHVNGHNRVITDPDFLTADERVKRVRNCMIQLFRGLAFLHRHNRIHRDIKPSNLLVNQARRLKLVDFGIVKELLPGGQGHSLSQVFGTSTYFSPEQSLGSDVTHASDNYSAGIVLYEMLAGVPPFIGESADVALKHRTDAPPSLAQKVPGAPPDLVLLCMKLLKKKPEERPTALEALEELDPEHEQSRPALAEFIGRAEPRKTLHESLGRVGDEQGQILLIVGESGLGKTALLDEFARESNLFGADFFSGTCTMRDHVALRGLDTVIERMAEAYRKETARALRRLNDAERGPLLEHFLFLKELLPVDEHGHLPEDGSVGIALSKLLDQLQKRRTLVIVIEQIELADELLLDTMEDLFSGSFMPPVLFIFTLNPRFIMPHSRVESFLGTLRRSPIGRQIELTPFGLEETIQFIEEHSYPAPRFIAEYILEESQGIPAYIGLLTQQLEQYRGGELPPLTETLTKQIERFDKNVRHLLSTMAVADEALPMTVLKTACNLSGEAIFEAIQELRFLKYVELLTTHEGENQIVPNEAHALRFVRQTLTGEVVRERHEALARALERHRGSIDRIRHHWSATLKPEKAIEYAWKAADQAEGDGDHERAAALLRVCLENASDLDTKTRTLRRLTDSLSRQGHYQDAWNALEELRSLLPEEDSRLRAKCCQYALLCGDLDGFENNFVRLPRAARPALAMLLVPYLPSRVTALLEGEESLESMMADAANRLNELAEKPVRESLGLLRRLPQETILSEPELKVSFSIIKSRLNLIQGLFSEAKETLAEVLPQDFDKIVEPHRFRPDFDLATAELQHACGDYLAARTTARNVARYARQFGRLGLATRAGILLAQLDFACKEVIEPNQVHAIRASWRPRVYSILDAQLDLLDLWLLLHQHQTEHALQKLSALEKRVHFANALDVRQVHASYIKLRARLMIYLMLTEGRIPSTSDTTHLAVQLRKHPGSGAELANILRLAELYANQVWSELEGTGHNRSRTTQDPLAEALGLAIRGAALERAQKGGMRSWQAAMHCLKNAGLALPPEIHHFRPNFERNKLNADAAKNG